MKSSLRGLYVIRGGAIGSAFTERAKKPDKVEETGNPEETSSGLGTLEVNFSKYNEWYRIDSFWEGSFIERVAPGSFKKTLNERGDQTKILFNHGMDPTTGDKVLAMPEEYGDRKESPFLAGSLFDTSYNRDLLPGLRAGAYGSSFMFEVLGESWENEPDKSEYNPDGLPERTITEVRLFEAGPVTWPANPGATAGMRCGTDWYGEQVRGHDGARYEDFVRSFEAFRKLNNLITPGADQAQRANTVPPTPDPGRHVTGMSASARARRLFTLTNGK